jgi:hypothetical protein
MMKISTIIATASTLMLALFLSESLDTSPKFAQTLTESEEDNREQTLHIIKDATNSYTISLGSSFIGAFDTTYSILGNVSSMEASKDLITSTIIDDFGNSPTVGYINNTSTSSAYQSNQTQLSLSNPFATKNAIDEKIRGEIATSIGNAAKSDQVEGEIKCLFGSSLNDFKCNFHR